MFGKRKTYYIGVHTQDRMKIDIIQGSKTAEEALNDVIKRYPCGIVTFIYKE